MRFRRPRRVMLVTQSTAMGGMEMHVQYLCAELLRRRVSVSAILPRGQAFDALALRCHALGASVLRLDTDGRNGRRAQVGDWMRYLRWARLQRPDVVHLHTGGATGGMAVAAASRWLLRATVVRTEHDVPEDHPCRRLQLSSRLADAGCDVVVAVSRRNAELRRTRLRAPRQFASVLNGVPVPPPCESSGGRWMTRESLGIGRAEVVVGTVVRLAEGKGLDDLIRAFSLVQSENSLRLLLVGEGPLRPSLELLVESLGIAGRVIFAGQQADPDPFFRAMDVFVLAVPTGSMSIALLEAMARSLPAVITFAGPEEAVLDGQTGRTSPPCDPAALAAVLADLVNDSSERTRLGRAGYEHVRSRLSAARVAEDLLAIYTTARSGRIPQHLRADAPPSAPNAQFAGPGDFGDDAASTLSARA